MKPQELLDEEALSNAHERAEPPSVEQAEPPHDEAAEAPQEGMDPEAENRPASPQEQKMFETMAKQVLQAVTSKEGTELVLAAAKQSSPEEAVAGIVGQAAMLAQQSAQQAGIQIPDAVAAASVTTTVALLVDALAQSGFVRDPKASLQQITEMINAKLAEV